VGVRSGDERRDPAGPGQPGLDRPRRIGVLAILLGAPAGRIGALAILIGAPAGRIGALAGRIGSTSVPIVEPAGTDRSDLNVERRALGS
jgi:hypothetical protein